MIVEGFSPANWSTTIPNPSITQPIRRFSLITYTSGRVSLSFPDIAFASAEQYLTSEVGRPSLKGRNEEIIGEQVRV